MPCQDSPLSHEPLLLPWENASMEEQCWLLSYSKNHGREYSFALETSEVRFMQPEVII